jgi:hypothetical protein
MRAVLMLAMSFALTALVPVTAHAQVGAGLHVFAKPFPYSDVDGPGTLTITPLSTASSYPNWQKIRVTLDQNRFRFSGAGVYHYSPDAAPPAPPITYLWFTLLGANGRSYFFEGRIEPAGADLKGQGTYFRVDVPQSSVPWQIQSSAQTQPQAQPIVNNTPELSTGWARIPFSEAVGGAYYGAGNTRTGATATATWSGTLAPGSYNVEVFIPSRFAGDLVFRPKSATYKIAAVGPIERQIDQNLGQSGWVTLASNVGFEGSYRIVLTNETGEDPGTVRVVASAVRLTPLVRP